MILLSIILPQVSYGDALKNALDQKNKAYNDYYEGYKKLGSSPTQTQLNELRSRTLSTAQANWAKELNMTAHQREAEIRQAVFNSIKKQIPEAATVSWITSPMNLFKKIKKKITGDSSPAEKDAGESHGGSTRSTLPPISIPDSPSNEGPVIDGSQFPKELSFPGVKK